MNFRMSAAIRAAFAVAALSVVGAATAGPARADAYPTKPIKIVVAFAPGGPADVMARLIAARLSPILGQNVFVENHPGAGGTLGARAVADSNPDGYTLLLGNTANLLISPLLYKNVGYDPAKAFAPIAGLGTTSNVLITNVAFGLKSVQEVIDYARKNPGKLNYSSAGIGTPLHLIGEMFKQRLGLDIVHVPYKSGGLATQAVLAGETQICFDSPEAALPSLQSGGVRGLAVTSEKRSPQTPNLPTMIEAGVPGFVSVSFTGVVAPAATPRALVDKLNAAINQTLESDEVRPALVHLAVETRIGSPDAFGAFLTKEREKWTVVVKQANIQMSE
jgi:tripartite-type tricarboxylate transporter receptor subunit TctC